MLDADNFLCKVTRNDGHWAVHSNSKLTILAPKALYATSYE